MVCAPLSNFDVLLTVSSESATDDTTVNPFGQPSETQIWQFNPSNSALTASWFDGTDHIPLTIFRNENIEDFADLQLTGDLSAFESTSGQGAQAVIFTFVTD
ncbi:hypothetical protein SISSUDRAFT_57012 [Sistotremastrum suecicum HHB10207 ss-3]|uniref:Uncharacterized protein n=1 Tax=Sistotremastrum suecicum HHB10207 ss-3 TaxID=1314776 RepID=A0A166BMC7_9AGAM|nr:hypothetical protein SISSUDRAFT_57012 [Sistotremastrum suecicum HHB10207 ss-3]